MNKNTITLNEFTFTIYNNDKVFGDGCHETTQGMLNLIALNDIKNKTILDLGTGSGILSIFATLSGASHVTAVDGDPYVFHFVKKNCEINQIDLSKINCQFNYLTDNIDTKFDIILSNLPDGPQTEALQVIHHNMHQDSILIFTLNKTFNVAEMLPNMSIIEMFEGEEYNTYAVKLAQ